MRLAFMAREFAFLRLRRAYSSADTLTVAGGGPRRMRTRGSRRRPSRPRGADGHDRERPRDDAVHMNVKVHHSLARDPLKAARLPKKTRASGIFSRRARVVVSE